MLMSVVSLNRSQAGQKISAAELLALPNEHDLELVHGKLAERTAGAESAFIAGQLFCRLNTYVELKGLGWAYSSGAGYILITNGEESVLKPDASFIGFHRLPPQAEIPKGYYGFPPDLAAEVVSPGDLAEEVDQKINDYLEAGVRLVWVVHPTSRTVTVHRSDNTTARVRESEYLDGENVLPGFQCKVADLFVVPQPAE